LPPNSVIIDRPNAIIASDTGFLKQSHIERLKSFAKIRVERDAGSIDKLSFVFVFQNPFSAAMRCDFHSVVRAHGTLALRQHGHISELGSLPASVRAIAKIEVTTLPAVVASVELAGLSFRFIRPAIWWVDHTEGPNEFSGVAPLNAANVFIRPS